MRYNEGYTNNFVFQDLNTEMSEGIALFTNAPNAEGRPFPSAVVAMPNYSNPSNSILIQTDGNITSTGIFYTTVANNNHYENLLFSPHFMYPR